MSGRVGVPPAGLRVSRNPWRMSPEVASQTDIRRVPGGRHEPGTSLTHLGVRRGRCRVYEDKDTDMGRQGEAGAGTRLGGRERERGVRALADQPRVRLQVVAALQGGRARRVAGSVAMSATASGKALRAVECSDCSGAGAPSALGGEKAARSAATRASAGAASGVQHHRRGVAQARPGARPCATRAGAAGALGAQAAGAVRA